MITIDPNRCVTAEVGSEIFLLDQQSGETFRIGGAGARLWALFVDGKTPAEAAAIVARETGAPYQRVLADTTTFVTDLQECGVLQGD